VFLEVFTLFPEQLVSSLLVLIFKNRTHLSVQVDIRKKKKGNFMFFRLRSRKHHLNTGHDPFRPGRGGIRPHTDVVA